MSKPASIPEQSLAENEFFLRDVPVAGGLRVAQVVAVFRVGDKLCATSALPAPRRSSVRGTPRRGYPDLPLARRAFRRLHRRVVARASADPARDLSRDGDVGRIDLE
jgi:hypothetical protein